MRAAIRALPAEYVRYTLADAVELLPPARLHAVVRQYLDLRRLRPDRKKARANLVADVKAFEHASLAGDSYESFEVNSQNFREQSRGTTHWIAEFRRLLGRCLKQGQKGNAAETCQAFGILFRLLDRLDEGRDDILLAGGESVTNVALELGYASPSAFTVMFRRAFGTTPPRDYGTFGRVPT